jgi:glycosyltransferase involved in cell wall biosynthesis
MKRRTIAHVISNLGVGGAEVMLRQFVTSDETSAWNQRVISLTTEGPIGAQLTSAGVSVTALEMQRGRFSVAGFVRLAALLRQYKPDVVQTWMYHADLLGGTAARLFARVPVVWGIHNSDFAPGTTKKSTYLTRAACVATSKWVPARIICCSRASADLHAHLGYPAHLLNVIPNGFDTRAFAPSEPARAEVRQELNIPPDALVVGMVARFDPQKGYDILVEAAARLRSMVPNAIFVLCGKDVTWDNAALRGWISSTPWADSFKLIGRRTDVARVYNAMDVATLSSPYGEAFPLALGEAMACGIPCVATDVGDSAFIIGDTGAVVPPRDAAALADGWKRLLTLPPLQRTSLGTAARRRIAEVFELRMIVHKYLDVYDDVLSRASDA